MTKPISVTPETMEKAARLIRAGGLVAFPTETVYGLGASAYDGEAVARIYEAKGRPRFNPLIVHVAALDDAEQLGLFTDVASRLARTFWPGPLTLVLTRRSDTQLSYLVSAGLPTVALRMPSHNVARALIKKAGVPIAAPSANKSGRVSATTAAHVAADFGSEVDMVLDGGPCIEGIESTIVNLAIGEQPALLRAGAVPREEIEAVLGCRMVRSAKNGTPQAPGMLASHYAPRAQLRLNADAPHSGEPYLAFGPTTPPGETLNLSVKGNLREAAANLFAHLRALDATGTATIAVAPIPDEGLGEAINDRLRRAAAPRLH